MPTPTTELIHDSGVVNTGQGYRSERYFKVWPERGNPSKVRTIVYVDSYLNQSRFVAEILTPERGWVELVKSIPGSHENSDMPSPHVRNESHKKQAAHNLSGWLLQAAVNVLS